MTAGAASPAPRRLVRPPWRVLCAILLGAATTSAVAWTFAALPIRTVGDWLNIGIRARTLAEGGGTLNCVGIVGTGRAAYSVSVYGYDDIGNRKLTDRAPEEIPPRALRCILFPWCCGHAPWPSETAGVTREVLASGWPSPAFNCAAETKRDNPVPGSNTGPPVPVILSGWRIPVRLASHFELTTTCGVPLLPTHPLWPGFALDTLLYAAAWLSLLTAAAALRRTLRRRRGRCPTCNYDLTGLPAPGPCPECGAAPGAPSAPAAVC